MSRQRNARPPRLRIEIGTRTVTARPLAVGLGSGIVALRVSGLTARTATRFVSPAVRNRMSALSGLVTAIRSTSRRTMRRCRYVKRRSQALIASKNVLGFGRPPSSGTGGAAGSAAASRAEGSATCSAAWPTLMRKAFRAGA